MTTERPSVGVSAHLAAHCHPACIVCGERNGDGLGLRFVKEADGAVVGSFACEGKYQGYPDQLHGGVIAMLADAAMTHCLFLHGISAVTGKLKLRFPHPVEVGVAATVRATLVRNSPPAFELEAEIAQAGIVRATAEALFIEQTDPSGGGPAQ